MSAPFAENTYGIVKRLRVIREWLKQLPAAAGNVTVLDYGCGTGDHITYPLALDGYDVLGVDVHEPSIQAARRRYQRDNLTFRTASLEVLAEEERRFDAIVCSEVLEHVQDPQRLLADLRRLMKPGGILIVTTPNGYGSYEVLCSLQRLLQKTGIHRVARALVRTKSGGNGTDPGFLNQESIHIQFFRLQALEAIFQDSGFYIAARRARTFICGPYADVVLNAIPFHRFFIRWNASVSDLLPLRCAADWMFLLRWKT